jgi:hypothetical protein
MAMELGISVHYIASRCVRETALSLMMEKLANDDTGHCMHVVRYINSNDGSNNKKH